MKKEKINTLEEFANWVWDNKFESLLSTFISSHFDQWIPTIPIAEAYENALEDLWNETLMNEFPDVEFNEKIKKDILKWCDENCGNTITIW